MMDAGVDGDRGLLDALFSPESLDDPQAVAARHSTMGCRWAVVDTVLRDRSTAAPSMPPSTDTMFDLLGRFLARIDGQRHDQVRRRFARVFTPRRAAGYAELIEHTAIGLLDALDTTGEFDLVGGYTRPLPF